METRTLAMLCLAGLLTACGGGGGSDTPKFNGIPPAPPLPTTGTGRLTVTVLNSQRRPLENARVELYLPRRTATTARNGTVTFDGLPGQIGIAVNHPLGDGFDDSIFPVAQQGDTTLEVVLETRLPRPTVALMPVEILPGSVTADRREIALRVTIIASSKGRVLFGRDGWGLETSTYLGLALDVSRANSQRDCNLVYEYWDDPAFACSAWGDPVHAVTATSFEFGTRRSEPLQSDPAAAPSTLLLIDQSRRMGQFTPDSERSFAALHLSDRLLQHAESPRPLAIAGFASVGGTDPPTLPSPPFWSPRGASAAFSNDVTTIESDIGVLESLTGGASPMFDALERAAQLANASSPTGGRTIVAVVSGDDQSGLTASQRDARLTVLRQVFRDGGVRPIFIAAVNDADVANGLAVAELAARLDAPYISTGVVDTRYMATTQGSGLFAATDLAADLVTGGPLWSLTATFRVRAPAPAAFTAGSLLQGLLFLETEICPVGCQEVSIPFAVRVP